ncbi:MULTISPECIES: hypothetical protein [unclassified Rhizobium]|nr:MULTISPECIES: hypothetical protein [unclassified Rhizobium]MBB3385532.1 hypothetical protein [Rhizobium sp. BK098]MBB3617237.1 hypothetical protein [Rhizobium sp. BK609]MBB3682927.1 hypothetical protein [Rhizobium sp. BK612]
MTDGRLDPLGRTTTDGFVIAVSDRSGGLHPWGDQLFPTMDAANMTAARCVTQPCDIVPARRITFMTGKPAFARYRSKILIGEPSVAKNS